MRALVVVIVHPGRDEIAGMGEVMEHGLVEKLVPHATVETFHETVLHGLSRRDVMPFDPVLGAPLQDRVRRQFRPVARREEGLPIGYGRAHSLQVA